MSETLTPSMAKEVKFVKTVVHPTVTELTLWVPTERQGKCIDLLDALTGQAGGCTRTNSYGEWIHPETGDVVTERVSVLHWVFNDQAITACVMMAQLVATRLLELGEKEVMAIVHSGSVHRRVMFSH